MFMKNPSKYIERKRIKLIAKFPFRQKKPINYFSTLFSFHQISQISFQPNKYISSESTQNPPKKIRTPPAVPEFCCGNGCERCVWNVYLEELKEYEEYLKEQKEKEQKLENTKENVPKERPKPKPIGEDGEEQQDVFLDDIGTQAFLQLEKKLSVKNKNEK